jgi:hypothetical protein
MNYVYGWKLEYFKGKIFNGSVPKKLRNKRTYDLLNYYFHEDPVSVFKTLDGHILGVFINDIEDKIMYGLQISVLDRIQTSIDQVITTEFSTFLLLNDPQLMEAKI